MKQKHKPSLAIDVSELEIQSALLSAHTILCNVTFSRAQLRNLRSEIFDFCRKKRVVKRGNSVLMISILPKVRETYPLARLCIFLVALPFFKIFKK